MRNKWWQACKELLGRPGRNILIAICIFVLTLFCGIATFLDSAIESFYKSFADMAGCCVLVELDDFSTLDDWKDILEYADNNKNVVGYNNALQVILYVKRQILKMYHIQKNKVILRKIKYMSVET